MFARRKAMLPGRHGRRALTSGMNSADLTRDQVQQLLDRALDDLSYYAKLRSRMKEQGFPTTDPLYVSVDQAHARLQDLRMHLHYEVCNRGGNGTRSPQNPAS
jgi:hypothetical protein